MRIMVVDDHALVRRGLTYVVKEGFPDADVVEAESSAAALELFHKGPDVDLALVDVRMPDLDGLELLRAIKADWPSRARDHALDLRERAVREARPRRRCLRATC